MKFHGIEMQGTLLTEKVSTLPSWSSDDEGRLVYADDVNKFYYGSNTGWVETGGSSGGGSSLPLILPKYCDLDDTDTDISRGSAFGMIETIDFGTTADGAIWFTFEFPDTLDDTTDIDLKMVYNLSGSDDSKIVTMQTEYWVYGSGDTPSEAAPDGTTSINISTGSGQDGARRVATLDPIPNAALTAGDTITLKFTRLSSDTYTGTFQMLYVYMSQAS